MGAGCERSVSSRFSMAPASADGARGETLCGRRESVSAVPDSVECRTVVTPVPRPAAVSWRALSPGSDFRKRVGTRARTPANSRRAQPRGGRFGRASSTSVARLTATFRPDGTHGSVVSALGRVLVKPISWNQPVSVGSSPVANLLELRNVSPCCSVGMF